MDAKQLKAIREDFGFVVSTTSDPDFLGYLVNCFLDDETKLNEAADSIETERFVTYLKKFVDHARDTLRKNPPAHMTYLDKGMALQLSNYQKLVFVEPVDEKPKPVVRSVQITHESNRGGGMRGMVQRDVTAPITGVEKKNG